MIRNRTAPNVGGKTSRNWKGEGMGVEKFVALILYDSGVIRPCLFMSSVASPRDSVTGRRWEEDVCVLFKLVPQYLASVSCSQVGIATIAVVFASSDVWTID